MTEGEVYEIGLETVILDQFKEGKLLTVWDIKGEEEETIHYKIKNIRAAMKDIYEVYQNPKATKKDFVAVIKKHDDKNVEDVHDFLAKLENEEEKFFRVAEKKVDKNGDVTIRLKKVDMGERTALISGIAKKLADKLSKEQIQSLLEEGLKKNEIPKLKKAKKMLEHDDVNVEGKKGCFKVKFGGIDLSIID